MTSRFIIFFLSLSLVVSHAFGQVPGNTPSEGDPSPTLPLKITTNNDGSVDTLSFSINGETWNIPNQNVSRNKTFELSAGKEYTLTLSPGQAIKPADHKVSMWYSIEPATPSSGLVMLIRESSEDDWSNSTVSGGSGDVQSKSWSVVVLEVELKSIKFTSDHGVLHENDSDYDASGQLYAEPEWEWVDEGDDAVNHPMTHTRNKQLAVDLTVNISPSGFSGADFSIAGTSSTPGFAFASSTQTLSGGDTVVSLTSSSNLANVVEKATGSISWTVSYGSTSLISESSGAHNVFLTLGTPRETSDSRFKVTDKRIERAVAELSGAPNYDSLFLLTNIVNNQVFDATKATTNAWTVPDATDGADCQSITRYAIKVANMLNIPGSIDHKNIYAVNSDPATAIEGIPPAGLANPPITNGAWFLQLVAGGTCSNADIPFPIGTAICNNFEAVVKLSDGGTTYLIAPGANYSVFTDKDDVLTVFTSMAWAKPVTTGSSITIEPQSIVHCY